MSILEVIILCLFWLGINLYVGGVASVAMRVESMFR